jgi:endogenous inhibitor of DNA gyrase (YacG/DUF329 family)
MCASFFSVNRSTPTAEQQDGKGNKTARTIDLQSQQNPCAIIRKRSGYAVKIICPICKTATTWEENPYRPFCSDECKMRDLGKWASEGYRVEGESQSEEEGKQPEEDEG